MVCEAMETATNWPKLMYTTSIITYVAGWIIIPILTALAVRYNIYGLRTHYLKQNYIFDNVDLFIGLLLWPILSILLLIISIAFAMCDAISYMWRKIANIK